MMILRASIFLKEKERERERERKKEKKKPSRKHTSA